jgi:fatty-acyl-CoA synthase/benzoate-CoA ligase/fatty acid CoA ligase FadD22
VNLTLRLEELAARNGWNDRPAYHCGERRWTHAEVHALAARLATVLAEHGVGRGDRVLLALPDEIGLVASFLAAARIGAVSVLVNPLLTVADHAYLSDDSDARLCVSKPELRERFTSWADVDTLLEAAAGADPHPAVECSDDAPMYVQYTSGTTGRPKGVVHRHGDVEEYHRASGAAVFAPTPEDVLLSVSKVYFTYGFDNSVAYPLFSGASSVLLPDQFGPDATADAVLRHEVSVLFAVPNAGVRLVACDRPEAFRSLRAVVCAGEALSDGLCRRMTEYFGAPVLNQIGATEVGQAFCANTVHTNVAGTIGVALPGFTLEVRDTDGRVLPDGSTGDLWVTGRTLADGYVGKPERTAAAFVDGWFCTRDLAARNPDGTYVHRGRGDDIEVVGGINISPHEVEEVLHTLDSIREVAVASVRDTRGTSRLTAFVVPAAHADPAQLQAQVQARAREHLVAFKVPKAVRVVDELPRTPSGKLRRFVLRGENTA